MEYRNSDEFAKRLIQFRKDTGKTQRAVAQEIGVNIKTISKIERGETANLNLRTQGKIERYFAQVAASESDEL